MLKNVFQKKKEIASMVALSHNLRLSQKKSLTQIHYFREVIRK